MIKNKNGQSTIEFILTFTAAVGFIFLFLKMAINYTNGYMVHHATYMASRHYLVNDAERQSVDDGDQAALKTAKLVFLKNKPEALINNFDGELQSNDPGGKTLSIFTGVWVQFTQAFSMGFVGGKDRVIFRSESFLGREPTRSESRIQVCTAISMITGGGCNIEATLDDNGG